MIKAIRTLAGLAGGVVIALAIGFVLFAATISHYTPRPIDSTADVLAGRGADAIVVLTGGEQRVQEALKLFSVGQVRRLKITGVNRALGLADLKRRAGLSPMLFDCCIDIDHAADTAANAEATRAWVQTWGFSRLIVVTSNYHMPRSLAELARALPGIDLVPHPVLSPNYKTETWWLHAGTAKLVATEYAKFLPSFARLAAARLLGPADIAPTAALSRAPRHSAATSLARN